MIKEIEWKQKDFIPRVNSVIYDQLGQEWKVTRVINSGIISVQLELVP